MATVTLQGIRVVRSGSLVLAIDALEVADGELLVVLGASGAGKSMLLRTIAGLDSPTSGAVLFDGVDVTARATADRDVAMVFQENVLFPHRDVRGNVAFPLEIRKTPGDEIRRRVEAEARVLEIEHLLSKKPSHLGAGHQQLVQAARALVRVPQVFLMDEPMARLDANLRVQMREEFRLLQQGYGVTTLFVTNDQDDAMVIADRVALLDRGWLQQVGAPLELYRAPANKHVARFIGSPPMGIVPGVATPDGGGFWLEFGAFRIRGWSPDLDAAPDGKVEIGVRPEDIVEDPSGTSVAVGRGYFVGSHGYAEIELFPGAWVEMRTDDPPPQPGATLRVRLRRLHVFSPASGRTLARIEDAAGWGG